MSQQRSAIIFILLTLALDAIGFGLIMPVMPNLLREVTGGDLADAAVWSGLLATGFALMQFIFGPVLGNLSDRFGRRPVLLISLAVLSGDFVALALAGSIWTIFVARLINGAAASTYGTAMSYLADISTPEQKAQRFGLVGAAFGVGFVLGPAIGGVLAEFGSRAPFIAAALVAALNFLFGLVVMRESLTPEKRRPFAWRRANPLAALGHIGKLPTLGRYLGVYVLHEFAFMVYPIIFSFFAIARFGWTPGMIGLSLAYYGVGFGLVQGLLIRPVTARLGRRQTVLFGVFISAVSFACMGLVHNGLWAIVLIPISCLSGLVMPALRAELSDRVPDTQQGELQGLMASLHALAMIAAPFVYSRVFALTTGDEALWTWPGAVFAIAAGLSLSAFVLLATPVRGSR